MGPIYSTSNYWQPPKCQPLGKKVEIKVQKLNTQIHNFDVCTYSSLQKGRFCIFSFSRFHVSLRCHERAGHDSATKREVKLLSRVRVFATPWTVACQATQSMGLSKQEYWSGFPFSSPRYIFLTRRSNLSSPAAPARAGKFNRGQHKVECRGASSSHPLASRPCLLWAALHMGFLNLIAFEKSFPCL